ncbi:hypothetical protein DMH03_14755 [Amycolatopsis sp. WAC 01376]|uniref:hypothetical protein n=1 Tax=Amycolatopsis sp. WAC 01376 TaxID=2203195 RepID=UPI000F7B0EE3|nr:hypothetical protein [Amycolatopsis sp. WAC 01376]RSM63258.1 hypothetical protein DMH03_14755 [Amycolatopsis sp. WAC 01376]
MKFPWRGYVNQLTYAAGLRHRADDELVERVADEVIRQRFFTLPVADYHRAATEALGSGERIAGEQDDEDATRDFLARLVRALDDRGPWPEPPYSTSGTSEWAALRDAPAVARVPLTDREIGAALNRVFAEEPPGIGDVRVLILRLRTGQQIALCASRPFAEPGVDLVTYDDPVSTVAAFGELTGIEVEPG